MGHEDFKSNWEVNKRPKDYYAILDVAPGATEDEIKSAYRKRAKDTHPDIPKNQGKEEEFKDIGEAYEILGDPQKKREYDLKYKIELKVAAPTPKPEKPEPTFDVNYQYNKNALKIKKNTDGLGGKIDIKG